MNFSDVLAVVVLMCGTFVGNDAKRWNSCGTGWYGYDCEDACHCLAGGCDGDGICNSYGCQPAWLGKRCDEQKQKPTITYQCLDPDDEDKQLKMTIQTHGVFYRDVSAVDENKKEKAWCWDTEVSPLHEPRDVITVKIKLTQRARKDMRRGQCPGKMLADDVYEWLFSIQEWKKVTLGMQQNIQVRCNFSSSETHTRFTNVSPRKTQTIHFTKLEENRDNVTLVLLDALTRQEVTNVSIGNPVVLQMRYDEKIKSITPRNCYVTTANQDRWQEIVDFNGCKVKDSPVKPFVSSADANAVETPWFPYFAYDGSPYTQYRCSYKLCFDSSCPLGCTRSRHIRSVSHTNVRVKTALP